MTFDGRASQMTSVPYGSMDAAGNDQHCVPPVWNPIYRNGDITLVPDARWGKAFRVRLNKDSRNPYWTGQTGSASCELTRRWTMVLGQRTVYANSILIEPGFQATGWGVCHQLGYPTLSSPPLAVGLDLNGLGLDRNAGILTHVHGDNWLGGSVIETPRFGYVTRIWYDLIVDVKWALDGTGSVVLLTRWRGSPVVSPDFHTRISRLKTPTFQALDPAVDPTAPKLTVMDKIGLYQANPGDNTIRGDNVVLMRGLTVHATRAAAKKALTA